MAEWIKVTHDLPEKPEVFAMSRLVGQNRGEVVLSLLKFWRWADRNTVDGTGLRVTSDDIDAIAGMPGFASAMRSVGWLAGEDDAMQVPKFERHNGNSAKARALEAEAKRLRRASGDLSDICPTNQAPNVGPEREESERREELSNRDRTDRGRSSQSPRSRKDISLEDRKSFDLSTVDWDAVTGMVLTVAKRVRPLTDRDRRAWLRFAVMAQTTFNEAWLIDAADAVATAKDGSKRGKQAHFVAVLKAKAAEQGVDADTFMAVTRRIEIPTHIWKSNILEVRK